MEYNKQIQNIPPSASIAKGLDSGSVLANFAVGSPDIPPPDQIIDLTEKFRKNPTYAYQPSKGTIKALTNIKSVVLDDDGEISIDSNFILCSGAKQGIYLTLKTITNQGDNVLMLQPYWLSYPPICTSLSLNSHFFELDTEDMSYNVTALKATLKEKKINVIIINNPNNPSGLLMSEQKLNDLIGYCKELNIWVLLDEVYKDLIFEDKPELHKGLTKNENVIRVGSLSKSLAVPGLRIGYVAGNEEFIKKYNLLNQHINTCINSYSTFITENIDKNIFKGYARKCADIYHSRFLAVASILSDKGFTVLPGISTFYMMVKVTPKFSSVNECLDTFNKKGIVVTEGEHYGSQFKDYIRICLTLPEDQLKKVLSLI